MESEKERFNVYNEGKVHVCEEMCKTCIFRPGNLMRLEPGRVKKMMMAAVEEGGTIPCHSTLFEQNGGQNAVCRGFFDAQKRKVAALALAEDMDIIRYVRLGNTSSSNAGLMGYVYGEDARGRAYRFTTTEARDEWVAKGKGKAAASKDPAVRRAKRAMRSQRGKWHKDGGGEVMVKDDEDPPTKWTAAGGR